MKRTVVLTFCLTLVWGAFAAAQGQNTMSVPASEKSRFQAEWRFRMTGTDSKDEQSQSKLVDFRAEFKTKYLLTESFMLDIQPSVRLQAGQTQSVDGADKAENKINLNQAAAHYTPFSFLRLSGGALNQRYIHTRLLMDDIAFPAARMETALKASNTRTAFIVETAIPTSTSLSTNTRELEPTPSLNTAGIKFRWQASKKAYVTASADYFIYNNLPSAVAQQSRLLGNEVEKISDAQWNFMSKFEGYEASTEVSIPVASSFTLTAGAEYLVNTKAASDVNSGSRAYAIGTFDFNEEVALNLDAGYFSIAPEAAVAYFNAAGFETNRIGYSLESSLSFKKAGFNVGIKYIDAEVMFTSIAQTREKTLLIKLETFYASI